MEHEPLTLCRMVESLDVAGESHKGSKAGYVVVGREHRVIATAYGYRDGWRISLCGAPLDRGGCPVSSYVDTVGAILRRVRSMLATNATNPARVY